MKNKILLYTVLFSGLSLLNSCQNDLTLESETVLVTEKYFKSVDDAQSANNGLYTLLRTQTQQNYYLLGGARSAEIKSGNQSPLNLANYYNNTLTAQNIDVDWGGLYTVVNQANLILKYVPTIEFPLTTTGASDKKRYLAQAYSMRALAYFIMARSWGGVPIVTTPTEDSSDQTKLTVPRNTIEETFAFIKQDLEMAIANFPDATNNKAQLSLPATLALKADVFLWTAKQLGGGNADLTTALAAINAIPAGPALLPNFKDVFNYANKGNNEIVFAVRYSLADINVGALSDNWNSFMFVGPNDFGKFSVEAVALFGTLGTGSGSVGISRVQPDTSRFNFTATDTRKDATYLTLYDPTTNAQVVTGLVKYNGTVTGTVRRYVSDIIIYRWADILLMKAEIKNALGQDPSMEMNQVMKRADPAASFTNGSPVANDAIILNERLKELAFEGKAWWDLVRFNKTDLVPSAVGKKVLFPISQATINFNPKITQNP